MIMKVANGYAYVWIDVTRVDQVLEEVTKNEIQRKQNIFKQANTAFVWLVDLPSDRLEQALNLLFETSVEITSTGAPGNYPLRAATTISSTHGPLKNSLQIRGLPATGSYMRFCYAGTLSSSTGEGEMVPLQHRGCTPAVMEIIAHTCKNMLAWLQRMTV